MSTPTPPDLRDELTDMVVRDLLGPAGGPDEELNQFEDHVYQRYLVGMLAPKSSEIAGGEMDELATGDGVEGEEGTPDSGVPRLVLWQRGMRLTADGRVATVSPLSQQQARKRHSAGARARSWIVTEEPVFDASSEFSRKFLAQGR